jgi:hypothetical protein
MLQAGEHKRLFVELQELSKAEGLDGGIIYDLAAVHAFAGTSAAKAASGKTDGEKNADHCIRQALALLERAFRAGLFKEPKNLERLKIDPRLDVLRSHSDYKNLLKRAESNQGR